MAAVADRKKEKKKKTTGNIPAAHLGGWGWSVVSKQCRGWVHQTLNGNGTLEEFWNSSAKDWGLVKRNEIAAIH